MSKLNGILERYPDISLRAVRDIWRARVENNAELNEAMRNDLQDEQLDRLIDVLGSQPFADFYADDGMFGEWLHNGFERGSCADTLVRGRLLQLFKTILVKG